MTERKQLLFLSAQFPVPVTSGTQFRVLGLIERLARSFDITLLSLISQQPSAAHLELLRPHCRRLVLVLPDNKRSAVHRGVFKALYWFRRVTMAECADRFYTMMPSVAGAIRRELREHRYDVLFLSYWFWSPWVYEANEFRVVDANDVQAERVGQELGRTRNPVERLLGCRLLGRYAQWEAEALRRADLVVATTERDRKIFEALTEGRTEHLVVPTGIDTDHFAPRVQAFDLQNVVFYGALRNPMNVDAVRHLVADVMPRIRERLPGTRLTIVGAFPSPEMCRMAAADPGITLTGYVEDVRESLARAGVVALPLRFGHGIRGRVFELLSMAVPVVASSVAVAGMGLPVGDGLLLADEPDAFAEAVARVLLDPALRAELGRRGRELAVARLSLAATYDRLVDYLEDASGVPRETRGETKATRVFETELPRRS